MAYPKSRGSSLRAFAALLVLAVIVALALFLRREDRGADAALAPASAEQAPTTVTTPLEPEVEPEESPTSRIAPQEPPAVATASPTPEGLFRLRILHFQTLEPIAGAQVRWVGISKLSDPARDPSLLDPLLEERWAKHGQVGTSDARGEIWIKPTEDTLRAEATCGKLRGGNHLWRGRPDGFVVLLGPDDELRVQVVDAYGHPAAGVGVSATAGGAGGGHHRADAMTGSDGIARLERVRRGVLDGGDGPLRVVACVVSSAPVERTLDSRPWPTEPVRLQLPPTGSLHLRCVDPDGQRIEDNVLVRIGTGRGATAGTTHWLAERGELEVLWVALGDALTINGQTVGLSPKYSGTPKQVAGPRTEGERVEFELTFEAPPVRLLGRALGPEGAALEDVSIAIASAADIWSLAEDRTGAGGQFELRLGYLPVKEERPLVLRLKSLALEAPIELPQRTEDRDLRLGDIRFTPVPQLVAGRVVDVEGRGIAGASVTVELRSGTLDLSGFSPEPGLETWSADPSATVRTDLAGRFVVHGKPADTERRLRASAEGYRAPDPQKLVPGDETLEFVMERAPTPIAGRVIVESQDSIRHLRLKCKPATGRWLGGGRFELMRENDAPVDLEILTDGDSPVGVDPLVRIEGIVDADDPRLACIDLRPLVSEFRVEVLAPPATFLNLLNVSAALPGAMTWNFTSGPSVLVLVPTSLVSGEPRLELRLTHPELPGDTFERVANGARLQLTHYPALLLRIPEALPPADGYAIYTVLARKPGAKPVTGKIEAGRAATLRIPAPGEWTVTWRLGNSAVELEVDKLVIEADDVVCELNCSAASVAAELERRRASQQ